MRKVVVYSGTRNVYKDIFVSLNTLLAHTKVDKVYLLLEDDEIPKYMDLEFPDVCEIINVSNQNYFHSSSPNYTSAWTYMALLKVVLPDILRNEDVVLHLDIDTIVMQDISDLWEVDLGNNYFAAVREPKKSTHGYTYCNVGVCLLNLKQMRKTGVWKTIVSELNTYHYHFPEQDSMAQFCQNYIKVLPGDYNVSPWTDKADEVKIIHLAGYSEWRYRPEWRKVSGEIDGDFVLFMSDRKLERAENIKAVWDAYDGNKAFVTHSAFRENQSVRDSGYKLVVGDDFSIGAKAPVIMIDHGCSGGKTYGLNQPNPYFTREDAKIIAYATTSSTETISLTAKECGIPEDKVIPTGMPRTDAYFGVKKGDGNTLLADKRAYLYCPTFRTFNKGVMPDLDFDLLDELLTDDEIFAVKMHMVTGDIMLPDYEHIVVLPSSEPSTPYLIDCDVLVTDYSSILFDAHILKKPVVLFEKDHEKYLAERGMYFKYPDEYASRHCRTERDLVDMLRSAQKPQKADEQCRKRSTGACDGHSVERTIDLIRSVL